MQKQREKYKGVVKREESPVPKKRRGVWFWVGLQLLVGIAIVGINVHFHVRASLLLPSQWGVIIALYYWQLKSYRLTGIDIVVPPGAFKKWDFIGIDGVGPRGIIYKTSVREEGYCITIFLFWPSRYILVNRIKVLVIKFAVWARLIK